MEFKDRLSSLRREKGIKQTELATLCGVSRITVARWENGTSEPSISELQLIAGALGVTASRLMGEKAGSEDKIIFRHGSLSLEIPTTEAGLSFLEKKLQDLTHWEKERELTLNAGEKTG